MATLAYKRIRLGGSVAASVFVMAAPASAADTRVIEEIVVTAQKRSENLQDVPVPVTALSGENLATNNQLRLQDWYTSIPSFTVAPQAVAGAQTLALRGLTTGVGNPTVGIAIDGIPYGNSSLLGGLAVPDFDPGDLARIEVLRGPQGTFYGANSLGGLVNFVTVDPSVEGVKGRVQVGATSVKNGDGLGYNARGSVNLPLSQSIALRASAFTNHEAGYVDNPVRGIDGINDLQTNGGRLALLWQASDAFSVKLGALYQKQEYDGLGVVHGLGDLQQDFVLDTPSFKEDQNYTATVSAQLGSATLTSLSGYNIQSFESTIDATQSGDTAFIVPLFPGSDSAKQVNASETKKLTQELRLDLPLGDDVELLLGGFWTQEDADWDVDFPVTNRATQQVVDYFVQSNIETFGKELAGFANLTYHFTDRFDVQFGGRYSEFQGHATSTDTGLFYNLFVNGVPVESLTAVGPDTTSHKFTYLVTPTFNVTPDVMVYARFASGFRSGGANLSGANFKPDETRNYELGIKADVLEQSLTLDISAYHIDWKDIQLYVNDPDTFLNILSNGGKAKSQGLEVSFQSKPAAGLTIAGWVSYNIAELTEDLAPNSLIRGADGDHLPYSQRFSGKLGVEQSFPVMGLLGYVAVDASSTDDRETEFAFNFPGFVRQSLAGYAQGNFRAGLQSESWTANLFVNNFTDKRGELSRAGDDNQFLIYTQPRTIGLSVAVTF
jgi:iron complex outermembrane recepter protein